MFISNESESKHYLLSLLHQYIQRPRKAVLRYVTMTLIFANIHQVYINLNVSSFCIFFSGECMSSPDSVMTSPQDPRCRISHILANLQRNPLCSVRYMVCSYLYTLYDNLHKYTPISKRVNYNSSIFHQPGKLATSSIAALIEPKEEDQSLLHMAGRFELHNQRDSLVTSQGDSRMPVQQI